jgi:hypothetical protein
VVQVGLRDFYRNEVAVANITMLTHFTRQTTCIVCTLAVKKQVPSKHTSNTDVN